MEIKFILKILKPFIRKKISEYTDKNTFNKCLEVASKETLKKIDNDNYDYMDDYKIIFKQESIDDISLKAFKVKSKEVVNFINDNFCEKVSNVKCIDKEIFNNYLIYFDNCLMNEFKQKIHLVYLICKIDKDEQFVQSFKENIDSELKLIKNALMKLKKAYQTIDEVDLKLSCDSKLYVGLDLFDFDDNKFINDLKNLLLIHDSNEINICGQYKVETFYATLYTLKEILGPRYNDKVFIFNSKYDLDNFEEDIPKGSIIINKFFDDDIRNIDNAINIHILSNIQINNCNIVLRNRTMYSLDKSLKKLKIDTIKIEEIKHKSKNCYPNLERYYAKYQSIITEKWAKSISRSNRQITMLVGQWTEGSNTNDIDIINYLLDGVKYDSFIEQIRSDELIEYPFVINRYNGSYEYISLASEEETWSTFSKSILKDKIEKFKDCAIKVIKTLPNTSKELYSSNIRKGILTSLIYLSIYDTHKKIATDVVKDFLDYIDGNNNLAYYNYFANILFYLIDINPKLIINKLYEDIKEREFSYKVFLDSDDYTSKSSIASIIDALERGLMYKDCYLNSFKALFTIYCMNNKNDYVENILIKTLNIYIQTTIVDKEKRKELCNLMIKENREIAILLLSKIIYAGSGSQWYDSIRFRVRTPDFKQNIEYKYDDVYEINKYYCNAILSDDISVSSMILLIKSGSFLYCSNDIKLKYINTLEKLISKSTDVEKFEIEFAIRKFIFDQQRYDRKLKKDDIIECYKKIIEKNNYINKEYKYLFIFAEYEHNIPFMDPLPYETVDLKTYEKDINTKVKSLENEFIKNNLNIDVLFDFFKKNDEYELKNEYLFNFAIDILKNRHDNNLSLFIEILNKTNDFRLFSFAIYKYDQKSYYDFLDYIINKVDNEVFITLCLPINFNDEHNIKYFYSLKYETRNSYWKNIDHVVIVSDNKDLYFDILDSLLNNNNLHAYIELVTSIFHLNREIIQPTDYLDILYKLDIPNLIKLNKNDNIMEIVNYLEIQFENVNDDNISNKMANIELYVLYEYSESKRVFLFDELNKDFRIYLNLYKNFYADGVNKGELFLIINKLKFCPGYINGKFNKDSFYDWINGFINGMTTIDKELRAYHDLGKLISYSYYDELDNIKPNIEIRRYIETLSGEKFTYFSNGYVYGVIGEPVIYTSDDGSFFENKKNEALREAKFFIEHNFNQMGDIYNRIAAYYDSKSEEIRRISENEF